MAKYEVVWDIERAYTLTVDADSAEAAVTIAARTPKEDWKLSNERSGFRTYGAAEVPPTGSNDRT